MGYDNIKPVKHGYFLAQELVVTGPEEIWRRHGNENWIYSSAKEARPYFEYFKDKVDGVDLVTFVYQDEDIPAVVEMAKLAQDYPIDLWLGPRIYKQIDNLPQPPARYTSWWMTPNGSIAPAMRDVKRRPDIDRLNPEAVKWFMEVYYEKFLKYFDRGLLHGLFWPEEKLGANLSSPASSNWGGEEYWWLPVYSDCSLEQWRKYCQRNKVIHEDTVVDCFPVHRSEMESQGRGKTKYYPGFAVRIPAYGERFVNLPRCTGVWEHWYRYIRQTFLENYLIPLSKQMHELNRDNSRWRGVVYFGTSTWTLPYERFTDPYASGVHLNGYQYGVDVEAMAKRPEITYIIHEFGDRPDLFRQTYAHNLFLELIGEHREKHGLLVHRLDDIAAGMCPLEERARWQFIKKYQPRLLSLYSLRRFYPLGGAFKAEDGETFFRRLKNYQQTRDPLVNEDEDIWSTALS